MSANKYVKKALKVVHERLREDNVILDFMNKVAEHPFWSQSYRSELDINEEFDENQVGI